MRSRGVPPEYVQLLARYPRFRDHAIKSMGGADGRQRVRRDSLQSFQIALPPTTILKSFEEKVSPAFRLVRVLGDQNRNVHAQRDLLLPKLISGEIDVTRAKHILKAAE